MMSIAADNWIVPVGNGMLVCVLPNELALVPNALSMVCKAYA